MKKSFAAVLEIALIGALGVVGCGPSATTDAGTPDAGCPGPADSARPDAGCPAPADAGCPAPRDSGRADAGCPAPADGGCPAPADAGCPAPTPLPAETSGYAAWLASNAYRAWRCDAMPQAPLPDSPHGRNIICVNSTLYAARAGTGAWPVGSAAVKVTYDAMGREAARFLDVRRTNAAGAAGWYFMRLPLGGSPGPAGLGSDATVGMACATCHASAGRDYVRRVP